MRGDAHGDRGSRGACSWVPSMPRPRACLQFETAIQSTLRRTEAQTTMKPGPWPRLVGLGPSTPGGRITEIDIAGPGGVAYKLRRGPRTDFALSDASRLHIGNGDCEERPCDYHKDDD